MCSHGGCGLASGVNHDELVRCVENSFSTDSTRVVSETSQAEYVGGKDAISVYAYEFTAPPPRVRAPDSLSFLPCLSSYCVQRGQVSVWCCVDGILLSSHSPPSQSERCTG